MLYHYQLLLPIFFSLTVGNKDILKNFIILPLKYESKIINDISYNPLPNNNITLNTSLGTIIGTHVDLGNNKNEKFFGKADAFFSVPFVHPPIGDLRLKHSIPINKFPNNPQIAQIQPPMCPQTLKKDNLTISEGESEDCLYINIFSPNVKTTNKYPVFVLIPGGGFDSGSIKEWGYKGFITNFVSNGIIVVVVQYRLGIHGFFTTFTDEIPPNRGVYDQTNALKFVKNYISEFGGDPNRITLAGHSTGAVSVTAQSLSPLSKNLFNQLIVMSADINLQFSGIMPLVNTDTNYNIAADLCNITKYEWDNYPMDYVNECIKNTPIQKFIDYQKWKLYSFVLYIDKDFIGFLPDTPTNLYQNIPLLPTVLGSVDQEVGRGLIDIFNSVKSLLNKNGYDMVLMLMSQLFTSDNNDQFAQLLYNFNVPLKTNSTDLYEWTKIVVNTAGGLGIYNFLALHSVNLLNKGNNNVYMYENSYVYNYCSKITLNGKIYNPLSHADDFFALTMRPEFFDSSNSNLINVNDIAMAHKLGTYWSMFIKNTSSLNGFSNPWQSITNPNNLKYLNIQSLYNDQLLDNYHKNDYQLYENTLSVVLSQWPFEDNVSRNNNGRKYPKSTTFKPSTMNTVPPTIKPTGYINNQYQPCNSSIIFSLTTSIDFTSELQFQKQLNLLSSNNIIEIYWNHFERIAVVSYNLNPNISINFNSVIDKNTFNDQLIKNVKRSNTGNSILKLLNLLSSDNFSYNINKPTNHFIFITSVDYNELKQSLKYSTILTKNGSLNFIVIGDNISTNDLTMLNPNGVYKINLNNPNYLALSNFILSNIKC
uniref:COesterase domain-containing protein n=1 Tax=Strongyloides stercoralis TaxID=6248 RepID=A0A0K0E739_STRER